MTYPDNVMSHRFLPLSIHNFLYIIDTKTCQISVIKELDIIEYLKISDDDTVWTIETQEKKRGVPKMFLRQYKVDETLQEIIKIGERQLYKYHSLVNSVIPLNDKKVVLFVERRKLVQLE